MHDGLTGLVNATFFHATLAREVDRSSRTGRSCGLLVLDIDHFKQINDTYGHRTGDSVLQIFAATIRDSLRAMDTAARIGGEEFAVILPECTPEAAVRAAIRVHARLNPLQVKVGSDSMGVTTSAGLVWTDLRSPASSAELLASADQQMYNAKKSGRSRLCHPPVGFTQVSTEERALLVFPSLGDAHDE